MLHVLWVNETPRTNGEVQKILYIEKKKRKFRAKDPIAGFRLF